MSEETKTITFDLDYQGRVYQGTKAGFDRSGDALLAGFRNGGVVELTADEAESFGVNLIAGAESIRRQAAGLVPE